VKESIIPSYPKLRKPPEFNTLPAWMYKPNLELDFF